MFVVEIVSLSALFLSFKSLLLVASAVRGVAVWGRGRLGRGRLLCSQQCCLQLVDCSGCEEEFGCNVMQHPEDIFD